MSTLIIAEHFENKIKKACLSAVTFGKKISHLLNEPYDILVIGSNLDEIKQELKEYGARRLLVVEDPDLEYYLAERYSPIISEIAKENRYKFIAATATAFGKDLMPQIAAALNAGMASDIIDIIKENGKILFRRPMFAGNVIAVVEVLTVPTVVTVRQTEFEPAIKSHPSSVIEIKYLKKPIPNIRYLGFEKTLSKRPDLVEARVVIAGGRGCKNQEGFKLVEELTDLLGGAVGATRAAVDTELCPNDLQVGQTGKIIAPELYIGVGISGAIQHIAGIKGSKVIVAINKDEEAPIFQVADYGLVANLFKAVPELIQEIKKIKQ
jgi:electron transfer flavoprotein alpha subunit